MLAATVLFTTAVTTQARADDDWTGAVSDDWFDPANWEGGSVPTVADDITLDTTTPNSTVVDGQDATVRDLFVGDVGTGTLTVENGGTVSNAVGAVGLGAGSTGTVTVTGAGSTWANSSALYVGASGTGTLTIEDGGTVSNTDGSVGFLPGSQGTVTVTGTNSTWANSGFLDVGGLGTGTLTIEDGGTVSNTRGQVGGGGAQGTVTVSGANSTWTNSGLLVVGNGGTGTLTIENGGAVSNTTGLVGVGAAGGSQGTVTVTGAGSTWANSDVLAVGNLGIGTLTIENGGAVSSASGLVGNADGGQGTVTVTGAGSTWTNAGDLAVGVLGTGTLTIADGGTVSNAFNGFVGREAGSTGTVTVSGAGSSWANSGFLDVGEFGTGTLTIEDGGAVSNAVGTVSNQAGSQGTVTVTGQGSSWVNSSDLFVGNLGTGTLTIENGGVVSDAFGTVGNFTDSQGTVTVSGQNSSWDNSGDLVVGSLGTGTLTIEDGATVSNTHGFVGSNGTGSQGTVTVSGAGSTWANSDVLTVGNLGTGTLTIQDGGAVSNTDSVVGNLAGATGNVTVTGADANWTNSGELVIGGAGSGTLAIDGGGTVSSGEAIIGRDVGGVGAMSVDGAGSAWNPAVNLFVGQAGTGALAITGGGAVATGNQGVIGFATGSAGTVTVTGPGSVWTLDDALQVGRMGTGELVIADGGTVSIDAPPSTNFRIIGARQGSTGTVTVTGAGSAWNGNGILLLADGGTGTLTIEAGGLVSSSVGVIGDSAGGTGAAIVSGAGSSWTNSDVLTIGNAGAGTLTIQDGGAVSNTDSVVGNSAGATGNVTVTGADASWTNSGFLDVGEFGTGALTIEAGGTVSNTRGFVGNGTGSQGTATVSGAGSSWTNSDVLTVGIAGTGMLTIEEGGAVSNTLGVVGAGTDSQGTVTVSGQNSIWDNNGNLVVGSLGTGTLTIEEGGAVSNAVGIVSNAAGSQGTVTVSGQNSTWTSSDALFVGNLGIGTLTIEDGGAVSNTIGRVGAGDGSQGTVTVTGANATWTSSGVLFVGNAGTGMLTIEDGGAVSNTDGFVGNFPGSQGTVTVRGANATWANSGFVDVGEFGTGALTIEAGGMVSDTQGFVGNGTGSQGTVTVSGQNSSWDNNGNLIVGNLGTGTLTIEEGGTVSNGPGFVGNGTGSQGTVTVTGAGSTWANNEGLGVGNAGIGTLTIEAGGAVSNVVGIVGNLAGSQGTVTVAGQNSTWTNSGFLDVGEFGTGTLTIADGGTVSNTQGFVGNGTGSQGTVTVSGAGAQWANTGGLNVGVAGTGTLTIEAGGTVSNTEGSVGDGDGAGDGSQGTVTVTGQNSSWVNSAGLAVGGAGTGELTIEDGGAVSNSNGVVGEVFRSQGAVTVTGAGSSWTSSGFLFIGDDGSGTLAIEDGGAVSNANVGYIGAGPFADGAVTVTGQGSTWTSSDLLVVGVEGTGTLTVADDGVVTAAGAFALAAQGDSQGTLNVGAAAGEMAVAPGTLDAATVLFGAGTGTINFNHSDTDYEFAPAISGDGTINQLAGTTILTGASSNTGVTDVDGGTLLVEGSLGDTATTVSDGGTLGGSGSIAGDVTVQDGGILAPGSSAGTLTLGSLSLDGGSLLDYELGQAGVIGGGVNDLIEVTGNLVLDGTLDITDIGGFGAGVYRLMNYGGDLTDNTLEFGALPTDVEDTDLLVQTAIDGQVNLVSTAGLTLTFWDGTVAGERNNDAIDGGDGTWTASDRNWTQADGALNGHWDNGEFAVFGGTAGNVEVVGEQAIAGLQFMAGYTLTEGTDGALRADGAETIIRVDPNVSATIGADISGDGGLVKTDTGTLVLSGDNSYLGGTTIRTGTLSVSSDANLGDASGGLALEGGTLQNTAAFGSARAVDLQADGGTFLTDAALTLDGVVSGAGRLVKAGDGTLTLSGDNSYGGGTRVLAGTLVGDAGSIRGDIANNATVVFDQSADAAFAGSIAGAGTMAKRGVGALTLTGSSALDWSIDAGALVSRSALFAGDATIADGARLRFEEQGDGGYAGTLVGAGSFEIAGDGVFALTGNSAGFAGTTLLETGTLRLDGALGGSTLVANGATLRGIGTLGSVDNAGTVAAGNSIGTLTLTGDYLHRDDAVLEAEIEPGGSSDLLDVAGSATLEGGSVQVVKLPGQYADGTRYTLIDADGGVVGTFDTFTQALPFLDLALAYDANHAYLDIARSDTEFGEICVTVNQCNVAETIDEVSVGGALPPDLTTVINELTTLDIDGALAGFDTLSGEAHAGFANVLLEGHALYGQTVTRRLAERREALGADRLHGGVWARAYGMSSELDGDGNVHGADIDLHGAAVGVDAWGTESWLIGASLNAMRVDADFRPGDGGEADAKNVALYTSVQGARWYLDGVLSFAWWDNEIERRIEVGAIQRQAQSEYGGHRLATYLETGWTFDVGERHRLQPLLSVEHAKLDNEGFREEGAGDVGLVGRAQDVERTTAGLGVRWTASFEGSAWTLEPTAQLRWLHGFGDESAAFDVAFAGAADTGFRVRGVTWPQDRGLVGIGLNARRGEHLDVFVDYDYQQGDGLEAHNLSAGLRYRW